MRKRNLDGEIKYFLQWLGQHSLPGFKDYSQDTYHSENYNTIYDELSFLGGEMKRAAINDDPKSFDQYKEQYEKIFSQASKTLAIEFFQRSVMKHTDMEIYSDEDCQKAAMHECWENEAIRYWLPLSALLKDGKGNEVHLVARKEHTPKGQNYVTVSELEYLKSSGRDPWAYCKQRGAA